MTRKESKAFWIGGNADGKAPSWSQSEPQWCETKTWDRGGFLGLHWDPEPPLKPGEKIMVKIVEVSSHRHRRKPAAKPGKENAHGS